MPGPEGQKLLPPGTCHPVGMQSDQGMDHQGPGWPAPGPGPGNHDPSRLRTNVTQRSGFFASPAGGQGGVDRASCSSLSCQPAPPAVSRICSGRFAPHRAQVMPGWWIVQLITSSATVWPASAAIAAGASTRSWFFCALLALEHRVLAPAVVRAEDLVAADLAGQQALHQRPVDQHRHAVLAAPGQRVGLDLPLEHVVGRLKGGQRALGGELLELGEREVRRPDRPGLPFVHQPLQLAGRFGHRHVRVGRVEIEQVRRGRSPAAAGSPRTRGGAWPGEASCACLPSASQCSPPLVAMTISLAGGPERPGDQPLALAVAAVQ